MKEFPSMLLSTIKAKQSVLCVGLDPDLSKIPDLFKRVTDTETILNFCEAVISSTLDYCIAYKPNLAFFEALGREGLNVYHEVISIIPETHFVISDAKRGDIGNTAAHYEKAIFGHSRTDAITVNPLMGFDSIEPYGAHPDKAVFALAYTSNSGASDFFTQQMADGKTFSVHVAQRLAEWDAQLQTHIGMVVGATQATKLNPVLEAHPNACLLIPGIGAQGGSVDEVFQCLKSHNSPALINSSRAIIYAGNDCSDLDSWQKAIVKACIQTVEQLSSITKLYP